MITFRNESTKRKCSKHETVIIRRVIIRDRVWGPCTRKFDLFEIFSALLENQEKEIFNFNYQVLTVVINGVCTTRKKMPGPDKGLATKYRYNKIEEDYRYIHELQ